MRLRNNDHKGFTLIEIIMVIVIIGIIGGMVAVFIAKPIQGYTDTVRRSELTNAADVALRRLQYDVRRAIPNSLREVTDTSGKVIGIEFIMTKNSGIYSGEGLTFNVVGAMPSNPAMLTNDYIVILNTGQTSLDAYAGANRAKITNISGNTVTLDSNPFTYPSPQSKFQLIDGTDKVIRYICNGLGTEGTLTRFSGCDFSTTTNCTSSAVLAGSTSSQPKASCTYNDSSSTINYHSAEMLRNGLLSIELKLTDNTNQESITLFQQIHVSEAP